MPTEVILETGDPVSETLPFICCTCGARASTADCKVHPDAVVVDLRDDLTLARLDEIADRRWNAS